MQTLAEFLQSAAIIVVFCFILPAIFIIQSHLREKE